MNNLTSQYYYMKPFAVLLIFLILLSSCSQSEKSQPADLVTQKSRIEKQIDSLNKILIEIDKKLNQNKAEDIPVIDAIVVDNQHFMHYIDLQGNIDTDGNVMVMPEVMGSVTKIYKNEGDRVVKGQIIMLLDDQVLRNQIAEVRTQYALAKTAYDRQKRLWDQKIGSEMAYLQAKTKKESLAKKLRTLQSQLSKFKVKAPISGTLDDLMIKEGEMAAPQRPVARVVNLSKVYMQADVSERYLPQIKKGTPVNIYFPEIQKQIKSTVNYVGNFIHPNNRTFKIRVNLVNVDGDLKPNLTGQLQIKDFETDSTIVLPLSLVQEDRNGQNYVYVLVPVKDRPDIYKVSKRLVTLGKSYKDLVMITSGLIPGDIIATQAARGLTEGDLVKVSKPDNLKPKDEAPVKGQQQTQKTKPVYHTVNKGETLFKIHKKYKVSLANLKAWNGLKSDAVKVGQKLIVKK